MTFCFIVNAQSLSHCGQAPMPPFKDSGNFLASAIPLPGSVLLLEVKAAIWARKQDNSKQGIINKNVFFFRLVLFILIEDIS